MMIFVSGATATHRRYAHTGRFGHLLTPSNGNSMRAILATGLPFACDNDAFTKPGFSPDGFRRLLVKAGGQPRCRFVACPDVVGDAKATLERFDAWAPEIAAAGLPVALVGQDGAEDMELPWGRLDAFFVGGSTGWKESRAAMDLCGEANRQGLWVHVGRVNSFRRLRKVFDWGSVDSMDGGCLSRWSNHHFPRFKHFLDRLEQQPLLWE